MSDNNTSTSLSAFFEGLFPQSHRAADDDDDNSASWFDALGSVPPSQGPTTSEATSIACTSQNAGLLEPPQQPRIPFALSNSIPPHMSGFQSNSFSKHDFNFNHPVQVPFNRQITAQDYGHGTQLNTTCTTNPIFPSFDTLVQLQLTHHGAHTTQSEAGSYNFPGGSQQNEFKPRTNLELQCSQKQYEPPVRAENDNGGGVALREPCSTESLQDIWREFEDIVSNRPTLDSTSQESLSGTTVPVTDQDPAAIILKWFEQMGLPSIDGQSLPHLQAPEETSIATTNGSIGNSRTLSPTPSGTCTASETRQSYSTDLRSLAQSDTEGQSAGTNQCISNTQTETEAARNSEGASATSPPVPARRELFELGFTDDNRCKKCSGLVANSRAAQDKHLESHLPPQFHCNIPNNAEGTNQAKCDYATCRIDQAKRHAVRDHNPLEVLKIMIPIKDVLDGLTALMIEQAADVIDAEGKHITDPHLELLNLLLRRGPMTREEYTQAKLESIVNNWRALDTATLPALTMASPAPKRSSESGESSQASEQTEAEQIMASRKLKKRKNHEGSRRGGALARMSSVGILETRRPEWWPYRLFRLRQNTGTATDRQKREGKEQEDAEELDKYLRNEEHLHHRKKGAEIVLPPKKRQRTDAYSASSVNPDAQDPSATIASPSH